MALKFGDGRIVTSAALKNAAGIISGSAFPMETSVRFNGTTDNMALDLTYPDKTTEEITHDMVKCATILCVGNFAIGNPMQPQTMENLTGVISRSFKRRQTVHSFSLFGGNAVFS